MTTIMVAPDRLRAWTHDAAEGTTRVVHELAVVDDDVAARWQADAGFRDPRPLLAQVRDVLARLLHLLAVADLVADEAERLDDRFVDGPLVALAARSAAGLTRPDDIARVLEALDDVARVQALWATLPAAVAGATRRRRPDVVAALDGVDMDSRDAANRALVARRMAHLHGEIARLEVDAIEAASIDDAVGLVSADLLTARADRVRARIEALEAIVAADRVLVWDPTGDGRAVVAWGDPDTASHVATFVPGMANSLATFGRVMRDASALHGAMATVAVTSTRRSTRASRASEAGAPAPTHTAPTDNAPTGAAPTDITPTHTAPTDTTPPSVATVAWLGYDAPSGLAWGLGEAATDDLARAEAHRLASWSDALRAANPGVVHTVVAHSYGSVLAGQALRMAGDRAGVDHLVVLGSPGLGSGIRRTSDLHLDDGRLSVAATRGDIVPMLPVLGPDPMGFAGAVKLPQGPANGGHSSYLAATSLGLDNVARAVLGLPPVAPTVW
ncbi:MAG TPA: alpha/beta hydrolase [Nitriliruptoraceae bacterium]|nr:alpha/beta hydrolase [Nitriliruptoraceae bacterium]